MAVGVHASAMALASPILHYADDTLIIVQVDVDQLSYLKLLMEDFSMATS